MLALNGRLTASIPAEQKMKAAKWMLRSINKHEAITWLKTVKDTSPTFVFDALIEIAYVELHEKIKAEVLDAITEEEVLF